MSRGKGLPAGSALLLAVAIVGCDGGALGPVDLSGGFRRIAVGADHSCGLAADGSAFCWGAGYDGRLGTGDDESRNVPARVAGGRTFVSLGVGASHTCALDPAGVAYCWGANSNGELGADHTNSAGVPTAVATDARFASISGGSAHTCAVTATGELYCWGDNTHGQTAAPAAQNVLSPRRVETDLTFDAVSAGSFHTCGVTRAGAAYCWGGNGLGQLGDGTQVDRQAPTEVGGGHQFRQLSAGHMHTCGVTLEGTLLCWGSSVHGELGNFASAPPPISGAVLPHPVTLPLSFALVDAGYHFTCAVDTQTGAWCWGRAPDGQLGNGRRLDAWSPQPVVAGGPEAIRLQDVSAGLTHACGVTTVGTALCWGRGDSGQLGIGARTLSTLAIRVRTE
ncbi:MAG: hypothetical protein WEF86_07815 [Gemmatimonadota bacterium]